MSQFISLSANPLASAKKLLVRASNHKLWVFMGAAVPMTPWMALHRESYTDTDLETFFAEGGGFRGAGLHNAYELASHFDLVDAHARMNADPGRYNRLVFDAVMAGQIKAVKFEDTADNYDNLLRPNSYYWVGQEAQQNTGNGQQQIENRLIVELGGLLLGRWQKADKDNAQFVHEPWLSRISMEASAALDGAKEACTELWGDLKKFGGVVVTAVNGAYNAVADFSVPDLHIDFDQLQAKLAKARLGFYQSLAEMKAALDKGYTILSTLLKQRRTCEAIFCFLDGYKESVGHIAGIRSAAKGAITITVDVLLALAAIFATAGLGAVVEGSAALTRVATAAVNTVEKVSEFVGPFTRKAISLMVELYQWVTQPVAKLADKAAQKIAHSVSTLRKAAKVAKAEAKAIKNSLKKPLDEEVPAGANARSAAKTCTGGEPIDMFTGAELLQLTDFVLEGNINLPWQRTYRSNQLKNTGMGCGWASPISQCLFARQHAGKSQMVLVDQEGREIYFDWPQGCTQTTNPQEQLELRQVGEQFIVRPSAPTNSPASRIELHFKPLNGGWVLAAYQDPHGNAIHFHYDESAHANTHIQPVRISNTEGREITLHWQHGLLTQVQCGQQTLATYTYTPGEDGQPDLQRAADAFGQAEQYTYQHHVFATRTLKTGYTFHFEWEGQGESARCVRQWGDPVNGQDTYHYRFEWNPAARQSAVIDTRGGRTSYQFNAQGLPLAITDPTGGTVQFEYDAFGRLLRQTDPAGHTDQFTYDTQGRLQSHTNKAGHTRQFEYSANPLPTEHKGHRYTYTPQGLLQSHTDPAGRTTRYIWNNAGQLSALRTPNGQHIRYHYADLGASSAVAAIVAPNAHGQESITRYEYDALGQCTAVFSPQGQTTRYQYNAQGLVCRIETEHQTLEYAYNGLSQVASKALYQQGKCVSQLHYHYDGERNLVGLTNEKGEQYRLAYDQAERLVEEQGFDGRTRRYQYDRAGHLLASLEVDPRPNTPAHQQVLARTQYKRNAFGQVLQATAIDHTAQGQAHSGTTQSTSSFEYDALGRLVKASNAHSHIGFAYNDDGQLVQEEQGDLTLTHTYNALGQRTQTTLRQGEGEYTQCETITYHWDETLSGTAQLQGMAYNGQQLLGLQHNALGLETARTHGAHLRTESQYDPQGRLLAQRTLKTGGSNTPSAVTLSERRYNYDTLGRIGQIDDLLRGTTQYHYDPLSRLKSVQGPVPEQFIFDPSSNLLGMLEGGQSDGSGTSPSDSIAQAAEGNRLAMQGDQHFTYDLLGRRIEKRWGKGQRFKQIYRYNANSQLALVQNQGEQTRYQYDAFGRRILKASEGQQTRFYWLGDSLIKEQHTSAALGTQSTTYLFEPEQGNSESFKPVALVKTSTQQPQGEIYHIHTDHLGTPQEVSNEAGEVIWAAQYRAYGAVKRQLKVAGGDVIAEGQPDPSFTMNLRFMGQYFDAETGLHYNRHRYYDPECGQFTTQDPIGLMGGLNNYQYVPNPVSWVDPLGLECEKSLKTPGIIKVHQYEATEQNPFGHFSVESISPIDRMHTHQIITLEDYSETTIVSATRYPASGSIVKSVEMSVPNVDSAISYQRNQINKALGAYDRRSNSCVTHVCQVLRNSGVDVPDGGLKEYKFLKGLGF